MNLELHQGDLDCLGQMWTWLSRSTVVLGAWFNPIHCHGNADRIDTGGNQQRIDSHGNQDGITTSGNQDRIATHGNQERV